MQGTGSCRRRQRCAALTWSAVAAAAATEAAASVAAATAAIAATAAAVLAVVAPAEARAAAAPPARALLPVRRRARRDVLQPPGHLLVCLLHMTADPIQRTLVFKLPCKQEQYGTALRLFQSPLFQSLLLACHTIQLCCLQAFSQCRQHRQSGCCCVTAHT